MAIKKVVIPSVEVNLICKLTENEVQKVIDNKDINNPYSIYPYQLANFHKIETPKITIESSMNIE